MKVTLTFFSTVIIWLIGSFNPAFSYSFCFEEWRPFAYQLGHENKGTVLEGIINNANSGIELTFLEMPHKRCVDSVKAGRVDFALFVDASDKVALYPTPINTWNIAVVTSDKHPITSKAELLSRGNGRYLIAQGYQYPQGFNDFLRKLPGLITPVSYYITNGSEARALFHYLETEQVDAMFIDAAWASSLKQEYQLGIWVSPYFVHQEPQFIGMREVTSDRLKLLDLLVPKTIAKH